MVVVTIDEAVVIAIREHEEWHRRAFPSVDVVQPRVTIYDGAKGVLRRPYKRIGHWTVTLFGRGRLVNPRVQDGMMVFGVDYNRP